MNQILSLCIPTYNRAKILEDYLLELAPQAAKYDVNIYVSDNASTDDTQQVVMSLMKRYPNIIYSRNNKDMGHEYNFMKVLRMVQTEYAWLLGDDDRITPEAIATMIKILSSGTYDLAIVNGGSKKNGRIIGRVNNDFPPIYSDQNNLLMDLGWHTTWISCLIFSKKMIDDADFKKYFNTNFLQFLVIFNYLAGKPFKVYWQQAALAYSLKNELPAWAESMFDVFGERWIKAVNALPSSYSLSAKAICIRNHGVNSRLFSIMKLLYFRLIGYYNNKVYNKYKDVMPSLIDYPKWLACIIANIPIPKTISNFIRMIVKKHIQKRK